MNEILTLLTAKYAHDEAVKEHGSHYGYIVTPLWDGDDIIPHTLDSSGHPFPPYGRLHYHEDCAICKRVKPEWDALDAT